MKLLPQFIWFTLCLALTACSTTTELMTDKKPLVSDQQLLMSLLGRPITDDYAMMLRFSVDANSPVFDSQHQTTMVVNYVSIRGAQVAAQDELPVNIFAQQIYNDVNAIAIRGPN